MQQRFVELDRYFVPVKGEQALSDGSAYWGRRYGGWVRWPQLLSHRRVVVLAGAGSGKTEEFKHQTRMQRQRGRAAFFVRLEELADTPFVDAIDHQLSSDLDQWLRGNEPGWFFLDAVDELKLRGKRLDAALRTIAKSLHTALDRAYIVISSRPTDWDWRTDPGSLSDRLRPLEPEPSHVELDRDAALVGPILERRPREAATAKDVGAAFEIQTFGLASLEQGHVRQIAEANGVVSVEPFLDAIAANNLDSLAQTPLDVDILVGYWNGKGRLDRLAQMVEYAVGRKLVERETNRPDGDRLSLEDARRGCERIAAAMTFGKALCVRFSQDDAHPTMEEASTEIASVLPEWSEAKRAALLRRGVFAPATFGRVRFHHRQTQDFLTACWLDRLIRDGHGDGVVTRLSFPEVHGESIVVPSLVPALAWLALSQPAVRERLLARQPLALVQAGDPSSLDLDTKRRVLTQFAALHRAGKVSNDMIWVRQLALFSDAGLAGTIRDIWTKDPTAEVRFQLLRIVGEAKITECADLCGEVAIDDSAKDYHRIVAVRALARCKTDELLARLADKIFHECRSIAEHVCCGLALELFPRHLDAVQLASIIDRTPRSRKLRTDGFAGKLDEFLATCRNAQDRRALLNELVRLCRQKPLSHDYERVSAKHKALAEHLGPLVRDALNRLGAGEPPSTAQDRAGGPAYSPNDRDRAEEARNGFLNAIINRPGLPSYEALHRLGSDRLWDASSHRAFELARERAEKDGDLSAPWTPLEVIEFERRRLSPIKNGDDLMRLVTEVLHDIQISFVRDDATSRDLLALAPDEDHVQNWFAEQLNLRSNHRFHATREARVANRKRSDVIVASTACDAQLAVEIKHGGKGWTVRDLEHALTAQLAGRYLKPMNRRHGILLVTNHNRQYWSCPDSRRQLRLAEVIRKLNRLAAKARTNSDNCVQLLAIGLDVGNLQRRASIVPTVPGVPRGHAYPQPNGADRLARRRRSAA